MDVSFISELRVILIFSLSLDEQCADFQVELDRARYELEEMNKILASKNAERKDLRMRIQKLEAAVEEKDAVRCIWAEENLSLLRFFEGGMFCWRTLY